MATQETTSADKTQSIVLAGVETRIDALELVYITHRPVDARKAAFIVEAPKGRQYSVNDQELDPWLSALNARARGSVERARAGLQAGTW